MANEFTPCTSEQCDRQVRLAVAFCCNPCANAWEATPLNALANLVTVLDSRLRELRS